MNALIDAFANLEDEKVLELVKKQLEEERNPAEILDDLKKGMDRVGERFSNNEYFLVELVMSADVFSSALEILEPKLLDSQKQSDKGKIVIGTVRGDIHYIGKNLVVAFLKANGYEVYDLGEDVRPEQFVEKIKETGANILALSGLITMTHEVMRETIEALKEAGIRDQVKVIIGGGDTDQEVVNFTGADAFGKDALSAVKLIRKLLSHNRSE